MISSDITDMWTCIQNAYLRFIGNCLSLAMINYDAMVVFFVTFSEQLVCIHFQNIAGENQTSSVFCLICFERKIGKSQKLQTLTCSFFQEHFWIRQRTQTKQFLWGHLTERLFHYKNLIENKTQKLHLENQKFFSFLKILKDVSTLTKSHCQQ